MGVAQKPLQSGESLPIDKLEECCVFCGKYADTREHVFAKCFFDRPYPDNLMTVPSCRKCNSSFSLNEQYLLYLIDYLKSIERNDGEFTRDAARKTFQHTDALENRMIDSIVADGVTTPFFVIEKERIDNVISKIACCLFKFHYDEAISLSQIECKWSFVPQLSLSQRAAIDQIEFIVLQEGLVKYYYTPQEIGFCLCDFFYGCANITFSQVCDN